MVTPPKQLSDTSAAENKKPSNRSPEESFGGLRGAPKMIVWLTVITATMSLISLAYQAAFPANYSPSSMATAVHSFGDCGVGIQANIMYPELLASNGFPGTAQPIVVQAQLNSGLAKCLPGLAGTSTPLPPQSTETPPAPTISITQSLPRPGGFDARDFGNASSVTSSFNGNSITYTIVFVEQGWLKFVNEQGTAIAPEVPMVFDPSGYARGEVFVQRLPRYDQPQHVPIGIALYLTSNGNNPTPVIEVSPVDLTIELESEASAVLRRFFQLLLGPTTGLASLLALVAGLTIQQWQKWSEWARQQADTRRQAQERLQDSIAKIRELSRRSPGHAVIEYLALASELEIKRSEKESVMADLQAVKKDLEKLSWKRDLIGLGYEARKAQELDKVLRILQAYDDFNDNLPSS